MASSLLLYLLHSLRTWLQLKWIRLNRWLVKVHPSSAQLHKIVVVGDGMAEGVGDTVPAATLFTDAPTRNALAFAHHKT